MPGGKPNIVVLATFVTYPPRMKAASFTIDQVQARLEAAIGAGH